MNTAERGLSFERVREIRWETALVWEDDRRDYGEKRFSGLGLIGRRHPPVAPWPGLSKERIALSVTAVAMLVLTWVPAPIHGQGWLLGK